MFSAEYKHWKSKSINCNSPQNQQTILQHFIEALQDQHQVLTLKWMKLSSLQVSFQLPSKTTMQNGEVGLSWVRGSKSDPLCNDSSVPLGLSSAKVA